MLKYWMYIRLVELGGARGVMLLVVSVLSALEAQFEVPIIQL